MALDQQFELGLCIVVVLLAFGASERVRVTSDGAWRALEPWIGGPKRQLLVVALLAIALLHNQVIQLKRGIFRRTNLLLSLMPFVLLTYSTFLTRSGVLADFSVHSFTDLGINQFLVAFSHSTTPSAEPLKEPRPSGTITL